MVRSIPIERQSKHTMKLMGSSQYQFTKCQGWAKDGILNQMAWPSPPFYFPHYSTMVCAFLFMMWNTCATTGWKEATEQNWSIDELTTEKISVGINIHLGGWTRGNWVDTGEHTSYLARAQKSFCVDLFLINVSFPNSYFFALSYCD